MGSGLIMPSEVHAVESEVIFRAFKHAFVTQLTDLGGETAAFDFKVIGKLLAVEGNVKAAAVRFFCLKGQVGQELISRGAL